MTVDASCKELKVGGASFLRASCTVDDNGSNLLDNLPFLIMMYYLLFVFQELESE